MSTLYKLSPTEKQSIKGFLLDALMAPALKYFDKKVGAIIVKNTNILGASHLSFSYKNQYYTLVGGPPPMPANRLSPEMRISMDALLAEKELFLNKEYPFLDATIVKILNASNNPLDYVEILPDSMKGLLNVDASKCLGLLRMGDASIAQFKEDNTVPLLALKKRMAMNLLLV